MKHLLPVLLLLCAAPVCRGEDAVQLDSKETVFDVLAAINVAGYDADLGSPLNSPLRAELRRKLASQPLPSVAALKRFYAEHRQPTDAATLSQYLSYALSVDHPPEFAMQFPVREIPPDVQALEGFGPLLTQFYREAKLDELWKAAQPQYEKALAAYQLPVSQALAEVNGYLRNPTSGYLGRRFFVYVDLIGAPNQIQARSYKDDYYVVLTPSAEPRTSDVRHGYLHYLLDPLSLKYGKQVLTKQGLRDYAEAAPHLDPAYKEDFLLLATECLIKAVEARLTPGSAAQKEVLVTRALREGYVLTPAFSELLAVYERQPTAMRLYYPDMIAQIDLRREEKRLANLEFSPDAPARPTNLAAAPAAPATKADRMLAQAEELYTGKNLERSKEVYVQVLQETTESGAHAKAYYGLGKIALAQRRPDEAERLLEKTLELQPDGFTRAWTEVYLGRLALDKDVPDEAVKLDEAAKHFEAALKVEGSSEAARKAASQGLSKLNRKQAGKEN